MEKWEEAIEWFTKEIDRTDENKNTKNNK